MMRAKRKRGSAQPKLKKLAVMLLGTGLLLAALPVWAHHAFSAEFDISKPLTLHGTFTKWEMINPHSWFHIDVKNPDGTTTEWLIEGGSPSTLIRLGVTKYTVKVGTELTIEAYQAKEGTNKAVGRNFILADGSRLFLSESGAVPGGAPASPDKK
jgi:hypothetical protein